MLVMCGGPQLATPESSGCGLKWEHNLLVNGKPFSFVWSAIIILTVQTLSIYGFCIICFWRALIVIVEHFNMTGILIRCLEKEMEGIKVQT